MQELGSREQKEAAAKCERETESLSAEAAHHVIVRKYREALAPAGLWSLKFPVKPFTPSISLLRFSDSHDSDRCSFLFRCLCCFQAFVKAEQQLQLSMAQATAEEEKTRHEAVSQISRHTLDDM
jgi:hypothetical protein